MFCQRIFSVVGRAREKNACKSTRKGLFQKRIKIGRADQKEESQPQNGPLASKREDQREGACGYFVESMEVESMEMEEEEEAPPNRFAGVGAFYFLPPNCE